MAERGLALTEECKDRLFNPFSSREKRALAEARKLLADLSLSAWVRDQNHTTGLAPSKGTYWRQWSGQSDTLQFVNCLGSSAAQEKSVRHLYIWMQRWASRWRVEQGRFKKGERLPLEVLRAKARTLRLWVVDFRPHARVSGRKRCPISGGQSRTKSFFLLNTRRRKRVAVLNHVLTDGQIWARS